MGLANYRMLQISIGVKSSPLSNFKTEILTNIRFRIFFFFQLLVGVCLFLIVFDGDRRKFSLVLILTI